MKRRVVVAAFGSVAAANLVAGVVAAASLPAPPSPVLTVAAPVVEAAVTTAAPATAAAVASLPAPPPSSAAPATRSAVAPLPSVFALPAAVAQPQVCPPPPLPPKPPTSPGPPDVPSVPDSAVPGAVATGARSAPVAAVAGEGIWVTNYKGQAYDARAVVAAAVTNHLHNVWVRAGDPVSGSYAAEALDPILDIAHAAGLTVIAWDYASLSDPAADAARGKLIVEHTSPGGSRVDGFSPDLESTFASAPRLAAYLSRVDLYTANTPVVATVPRATDYFWANFPYAAMQPYVDVYAPMIYWSCTEPGVATDQSVQRLKTLRPVHAVGQAYDMKEEGGRWGVPSTAETWRFLDVAKRDGAVGASLYVFSQTTEQQWVAMRTYPWKS